MKKKLLLVAIAALTVIVALSLVACGVDVDGGDASIANDYNSETTERNVNSLRTTNGYYLKYTLFASSSDDDEDTREEMILAANGDVYYYKQNGEETIFDLSNQEYSVSYEKDESENDWSKTITYYDGQYYTQANVKAAAMTEFNVAGLYMTYYADMGMEDGMSKSSATVAGRSCDKYSWGVSASMLVASVNYHYDCYIDTATGICLKWTFTGSASAMGQGSGSGAVNFECQEFRTNYNINLPQVSAQNTTTNDYRNVGGNGQGGNGQGGNGNVDDQGNVIGGEGGEGGSGSVIGGEGEVEQDRGPFYAKRLAATSVTIEDNRALEAAFANAYAQLYDNHNFELISDAGCLLGNYVVIGNTAYLNVLKIYANGEYNYEAAEYMDEIEIAYDQTSGTYALSFEMQIRDEYVTVEMTAAEQGRISGHDNDVCPLDPNEYGYDPVYQVSAEVWNGIFKGDYLFEEIGNFTVNYDVQSQTWPYSGKFEVADDVLNDNDQIIHVRETWEPDEDGQYDFLEYYADGHGGWSNMGTGYFDLTDWWDRFTGAIPADFMKAGYNSVSHKYYIDRFTYTPEGESRVSVTDFGAWFNNGLLTKVQYTKDGETYTYTFSEYGTTEIEVPNK